MKSKSPSSVSNLLEEMSETVALLAIVADVFPKLQSLQPKPLHDALYHADRRHVSMLIVALAEGVGTTPSRMLERRVPPVDANQDASNTPSEAALFIARALYKKRKDPIPEEKSSLHDALIENAIFRDALLIDTLDRLGYIHSLDEH